LQGILGKRNSYSSVNDRKQGNRSTKVHQNAFRFKVWATLCRDEEWAAKNEQGGRGTGEIFNVRNKGGPERGDGLLQHRTSPLCFHDTYNNNAIITLRYSTVKARMGEGTRKGSLHQVPSTEEKEEMGGKAVCHETTQATTRGSAQGNVANQIPLLL